MRAGLALAFALAALLAVAASAVAEPPTPAEPLRGAFTPVTLPLADPVTPDRSGPVPAPAGSPAGALVEPGSPPVATLAPRRQPAAPKQVLVKPTPTPRPVARQARAGSGGGNAIRGLASWYCNADGGRAQRSPCHYRYPDTGGFDAYAAAGPRLRAALGGGERWRGRVVQVNGIAVKLVDWCQCYRGERHEKIIDLYYDVFRRAGSEVTVRW